jgi:ABC-type lipoprotein release transport system permease subunit
MYYLGSLALPPMGIIWGMRYVRQNDQTSKIVGIVLIALTVFILIVSMQIVMGIINQVNSQMTTTLSTFQGF